MCKLNQQTVYCIADLRSNPVNKVLPKTWQNKHEKFMTLQFSRINTIDVNIDCVVVSQNDNIYAALLVENDDKLRNLRVYISQVHLDHYLISNIAR